MSPIDYEEMLDRVKERQGKFREDFLKLEFRLTVVETDFREHLAVANGMQKDLVSIKKYSLIILCALVGSILTIVAHELGWLEAVSLFFSMVK